MVKCIAHFAKAIHKFPSAPAKGHVLQNKYGAAKNIPALNDFLLLAQLEVSD